MRLFRWLSAKEIPEDCDLRRCGWQLAASDDVTAWADAAAGAEQACCPLLADTGSIEAPMWIRLLSASGWPLRRRVVLLGVNRPDERARLLRLGFGDALPGHPPLAELDARAERVSHSAAMVPRIRRHGPLHLDLLLREAFAEGRALGLHPREFALLWRLAEAPGQPVPRGTLLREVWRLHHLPETNSLAVHVCRLRGKLALSGCDHLIHTTDAGEYMLLPDYAAAAAHHLPPPRLMRAAGVSGLGDGCTR